MNQRNRFAQVIRGLVLESTGIAVLLFLFLTMHANAGEETNRDENGYVPAITSVEGDQVQFPILERVSEIFSIGDTAEVDRPIPIRPPSWASWSQPRTAGVSSSW